jgi:hypothetical protein
MSSARLAELFRCLKLIRRIVDTTHDVAERAIRETANVRTLVDEIGPPTSEALILRLVDERETLAKQLESIRQELELVNITPRTQNLGKGARGSTKKPASPAIPKPRPIKAGLKPRRKGSA